MALEYTIHPWKVWATNNWEQTQAMRDLWWWHTFFNLKQSKRSDFCSYNCNTWAWRYLNLHYFCFLKFQEHDVLIFSQSTSLVYMLLPSWLSSVGRHNSYYDPYNEVPLNARWSKMSSNILVFSLEHVRASFKLFEDCASDRIGTNISWASLRLLP